MKRLDIDILAQRVATVRGAKTGEVYIDDAIGEGADGILAGHSEARANFAEENDQAINRQIKEALARGLRRVVLCVGETAEEKKGGPTEEVISTQVRDGLAGLAPEQVGSIVIAYEPRWAIKGSGYGRPAEPEDAQSAASLIRGIIEERFSAEAARRARILYGGSVDKGNATCFLSLPDIDGLLVGGKSTTIDEFIPIVEAARDVGATEERVPYVGGNWKTYEVKDDYRRFIEILGAFDPTRVSVGIAPSLTKIGRLAEARGSGTPSGF